MYISLQSGDLHLYLESVIPAYTALQLYTASPFAAAHTSPSWLHAELCRGQPLQKLKEPVVNPSMALMLFRSTWPPPIHLRYNWQRTEVSQTCESLKPTPKPAGPSLFPIHIRIKISDLDYEFYLFPPRSLALHWFFSYFP